MILKKINDLQRDNEGMKQALLDVSTSVEGLATKTDKTHI